MKIVVVTLLAFALLLPFAPARADPIPVGPCLVDSSLTHPGDIVAVQCNDPGSGDELLWVSWGTCNGDFDGATVRVLGEGVDCLP